MTGTSINCLSSTKRRLFVDSVLEKGLLSTKSHLSVDNVLEKGLLSTKSRLSVDGVKEIGWPTNTCAVWFPFWGNNSGISILSCLSQC